MKADAFLPAKEAARLLRLSLVKVLRWAHEGKIPCRIEGGEPVFLRSEVEDWADERGLSLDVSAAALTAPDSTAPGRLLILLEAVKSGGVRFEIEGQDLVRVLRNCVRTLPFPAERKDGILEELLDREEAASTGLGRGVAVPHPRQPQGQELSGPLIPVFFLERPVDFNAVDGLPVDVLFMMFSPTTKIHLELLAKLSFLLRKDGFLEALRAAGTEQEVFSVIESAEPG